MECTERGSIVDILRRVMDDLAMKRNETKPKNIESEMIDRVTENDINLDIFAEQVQNDDPGNKKFCSIIFNGDYIERYMKAGCHKERISQVYEPLLESLRKMKPPMR